MPHTHTYIHTRTRTRARTHARTHTGSISIWTLAIKIQNKKRNLNKIWFNIMHSTCTCSACIFMHHCSFDNTSYESVFVYDGAIGPDLSVWSDACVNTFNIFTKSYSVLNSKWIQCCTHTAPQKSTLSISFF